VCFVYISPSSSSDWGNDWLGSDETVDSGDSRTFGLPSDTYDMYAEDCDGNTLDEQYDVSVTNDVDWIIGQAGGQSASASITLNNNSGQEICFVYVSAASSSDWGDDWLGESETVESGDSRTFYLDAPGVYDMYAENCDGSTLDEQYDVVVNGSIDWNLGYVGNEAASVTLQNNSSSAVCYVLISPSSDSSWGDDWLGEDETIDPGYERAFHMPEGIYDFQALDCAENVLSELSGIDISGDKTWTVD